MKGLFKESERLKHIIRNESNWLDLLNDDKATIKAQLFEPSTPYSKMEYLKKRLIKIDAEILEVSEKIKICEDSLKKITELLR